MAAVDMVKLCAGNLGKTFHRLKTEANSCPPWEKLKEAPFWKEPATFQRMYDVLRGSISRPSAVVQSAVSTESGNVHTAMIELVQEGRPVQKNAAWGPLEALAAHRRVHLWLVEVANEAIGEDICKLVEQHKDSYLIVVGAELGVFKTAQSFGSMKESHPLLWRYKSTVLHLFMKEDPPLGPKVPPHVNVHRRILLLSPHPFKQHRSYIATDFGWRTSILLHLMSILDIPPKNVLLTMLYLPHAERPVSDTLCKVGQFLALAPNWQASFAVSQCELSELEITATLRSHVQASHSAVEQANLERQTLQRGMCLNSMSLVSKKKPATSPESPHIDRFADTALAEMAEKSGDEPPVPAEGDVGSVKSGGTSKSKPTDARKRGQQSSSSSSALDARQAAAKTRSHAEQLEKEAEETADKAAKKARLSSVGKSSRATAGRKKAGASDNVGNIDLDDFPTGDA